MRGLSLRKAFEREAWQHALVLLSQPPAQILQFMPLDNVTDMLADQLSTMPSLGGICFAVISSCSGRNDVEPGSM